MSIAPVIKMGNTKLFSPSEKVTFPLSSEIKNIIQDMIDTMDYTNGVGIAAPQIGYNKRIIVYGVKINPRYPDAPSISLTIMINPTLKIIDEEKIPGFEGCLSIPGLRAEIPRYKKIFCSWFDEHGNSFEKIAYDFEARILQHECDHLEGILFPARIENFKKFGFEDELQTIK